MFGKIVAFIAALFFIACGAVPASAQHCPRATPAGADTASVAQALQGRLTHHAGIRDWFELKLDRPMCGHKSIQVTVSNDHWEPVERMRGCRVQSYGKIDFSPTGYYSLNLFQDVTRLKPVGACVRQPLFADYSNVRPDRHVRSYTVAMHVDYRPGDHPVLFKVTSGGRILHPWQAYASYMLTGGLVLYGLCGDGFAVDRIYGTRAARPAHSDDPRGSGDMAQFDPETAAAAGKTDLHLGYSCIRAR